MLFRPTHGLAGWHRRLLCATLFVLAGPALAAPRTPAADSEVLERLPTRAGDATARELAALRGAARAAPADADAATRLAQRYFELAMARGDPRFVGYAEAVVGGFPGALPAPLLTTRGMLRQYRHDFDAALQDFAQVLKLDPDFALAHAWRGAIYLVRADYAAAAIECNALQQLGRPVLFGGCQALLQAYGGQLDSGYQTLARALALATDPGNRLWLLTRLGEVAAWRGQPVQAERHYREALALGLDDGYLLAAWSDFLLDQRRASEVVRQLASWESADGLLLRLAQAEAELGLPGAERHMQMLEDRFAAAQARGDSTHRAEEARFRLLRQQLKPALALARENYRVQREPRDARILLEAAVAARDSAAAEPARAWLRSSGFVDARLRQLGQKSAAPN